MSSRKVTFQANFNKADYNPNNQFIILSLSMELQGTITVHSMPVKEVI